MPDDHSLWSHQDFLDDEAQHLLALRDGGAVGLLPQTGQEALERGKQVAQETAQTAAETAKGAASDVRDQAQQTAQHHAEELKQSAQENAQEVTASAPTQ